METNQGDNLGGTSTSHVVALAKETMNTNDNDRPDTPLPEVKHERLPGTKVDMVTFKDSKGKEHPGREESFTEKEIPNTHLTQIAPMFYYCTDNNKILMIPFSVQFSVYEFLQLAAKMSGSLQDILNKTEEAKKEAEPEKKT